MKVYTLFSIVAAALAVFGVWVGVSGDYFSGSKILLISVALNTWAILIKNKENNNAPK